jgi:tripartite-type tricarboxylate transporter receptor subunit TctC
MSIKRTNQTMKFTENSVNLLQAGRLFLSLAMVTSVMVKPAFAQEWAPSKPVRIIVPIVGSTNDAIARLVAPRLQEAIGQPVIVENKPGAGGNIGAEFVARSSPDGHTLLVGYNGPLAINVSLFEKMPIDPQRDLAPITLAVKSPQYLVAGPAADFSTVQEFVGKAKAAPAKYSYASIAVGSASHLTMEKFKRLAGFSAAHVPYKGATPAVTDLLAGNVQLAFMVPGNVKQFVQQGKLSLLATTGEKRFPNTPNVPTLIELGFKEMEATGWVGFLAPSGTPRAIIDRYNKEISKILRTPDMVSKMADMEYEVIASSPEQFAQWIKSETQHWGAVVKATGAKAD